MTTGCSRYGTGRLPSPRSAPRRILGPQRRVLFELFRKVDPRGGALHVPVFWGLPMARHFRQRQLSLGLVAAPERPSICGRSRQDLLTAFTRQVAVFVSLRPILSKAPDFAKSVRISKSLISYGNSERKLRTFGGSFGCAERTEISALILLSVSESPVRSRFRP